MMISYGRQEARKPRKPSCRAPRRMAGASMARNPVGLVGLASEFQQIPCISLFSTLKKGIEEVNSSRIQPRRRPKAVAIWEEKAFEAAKQCLETSESTIRSLPAA